MTGLRWAASGPAAPGLPGRLLAALTGFSLSPQGQRPENPSDLLQKVRQAPAAQSYAVQEGEGFSLRPG